MVNEEGAIIAEQFRIEGLFDRMDALGRGVLGLTLQCAQCHTHKYDPVSHEEYFRLFAYLNNDYEAQTHVYDAAKRAQIAELHAGLAAQEARLRERVPDWEARLAAWAETVRTAPEPWQTLKPIEPDWLGGLAHPEVMPDDSVLSLGFRPTSGELVVRAETRATNLTGLRFEALTHGDLPFRGPGRSARGTFALAELVAEARPLGGTNAWTALAFTNATADFAQPEGRIPEFFRRGGDDKRLVGPASFLVDGKDETAWGTDAGPGRRHRDYEWAGQFAGTNRPAYAGGAEFRFTLKYRHGGEDIHGRGNQYLGRFRLAVTAAENPQANPVPPAVRAALRRPPAERTPAQRAALFTAWREALAAAPTNSADAAADAVAVAAREVHAAIEAFWARHPEGDSVLNLAPRDPEWTRATRILDRGNWQKPTREVTPGTPAFLPPLPAAGAGTAGCPRRRAWR
jgi:hypothetical protein